MISHFASLWIWLPQVVSRLHDVDARVTKQTLDCSQHQGKNKLATTPWLSITEHFLAHKMERRITSTAGTLQLFKCRSGVRIEIPFELQQWQQVSLHQYYARPLKWAVKKQLSESRNNRTFHFNSLNICCQVHFTACYMWIKHFSAWCRPQFLWAIGGAHREVIPLATDGKSYHACLGKT